MLHGREYNVGRNAVSVMAGLALLLCVPAGRSQNVGISEFMAVNSATLQDEDGDSSDWIELHNGATTSADLAGWHLTDDAGNLAKWAFPATNIPPHGFLVVYASGKDRARADAPLHANFRLSGDGEYLALVDPLTNAVSAFAPRYPVQHADVSYGFAVGADPGVATYLQPTPGTSNTAGTVFLAPPPVFSAPGGFYTDDVVLEMRLDTNAGSVIRFTLDCSEPTTNAPAYTNALVLRSRAGEANVFSEIRTTRDPFGWLPDWVPPAGEVFKGTVVRARLFRDGTPVSQITTATYLIDPAIATRYSTLPVISVVSDPAHLFDDATGIFVPGDTHVDGDSWSGNYAQDWERPAHIELFETNRTTGFAQDVGVRIQGSTSIASPQKGLHVIARSQYGDNRIRYPVFHCADSSASRLTEFKRFAIRGWSSCLKFSLINDAFAHTIMSDANIDIQDYRPAVMFVNGEYWGLYELREANKNPWYYQYHYGVDARDPGYDIWEISRGRWTVDEGTADHWVALTNYIHTHDMALPESYAHVATQIDIPGFIAYVGHCIYSGKADWPGQNEARVRSRTPDGKWRWPQFDMDHAFTGLGSTYSLPHYNLLERVLRGGRQEWLLIELLANQRFEHDFINGFADNMNSRLLPNVLRAHHARMFNEILPYVPEYRHRWPLAGNANWDTRTAPILDFADQRPGYIRQFLLDEFGLAGTVTVTLDVSSPDHGAVRINTLDVNESTKGVSTNVYPWQGTYFAGVPITLTALPRSGYRFREWNGPDRFPPDPYVLTPSGDVSVTAVFEVDPFYPAGLTVTEIMFAPMPPVSGTNVASDFEFIELCNLGTNRADLTGLRFSDGVDFVFPAMTLGTGECVVVVADRGAFRSRYDTNGVLVAGEFAGLLDNDGERVVLDDGKGFSLCAFSYDSGRGWPLGAAGAGHALVPLAPARKAGLNHGGNWRAGTFIQGSPGRRDPTVPLTVQLNELAANTTYNGGEPWQDSNDWIELLNVGTGTVAFADWYLSDSSLDLKKWAMPSGRTVGSGERVRFTEVDHFHPATNAGFGLDAAGEQLFLSYLPGTAQDRVADAVRFQGQEEGVSLGRSPEESPWWHALPRTPEDANPAPTNRAVVSEVMYAPGPAQDAYLHEYVELWNAGSSNLPLWVEGGAQGTNGHLPWRLDGGVEYMFPSGTVLSVDERVLVVPFAPADASAVASFRRSYGIEGLAVRFFGPYGGRLDNGGDRVSLEKAVLPDRPGDRLGWAIVDEVIYADVEPWPTSAAGPGRPLVRERVHGHGRDPASWGAGLVPSPGNPPPMVGITAPANRTEVFPGDQLMVCAEVSAGAFGGNRSVVALFVDQAEVGLDATEPYCVQWQATLSPGDHVLRAAASHDGAAYTSLPVVVTVLELPIIDLSAGATQVTDEAATLNASLLAGGPADVTFFRGGTDGGSDAQAWDAVSLLGVKNEGPCAATVQGLGARRTYAYRVRAMRAGRAFWSANAEWFTTSSLESWHYSMRVGFPGYGGDTTLSNFPALITFAPGTPGFSYAQFASRDGHDLRFADDRGNRLDHELVTWNTTGVSRAWVRVPAFETGVTIRAYWGYAAPAPAAFTTNGSVWAEDYCGVWHFDKGPHGTAFADSAGGGFHGVPTGSTTATGQVGQARVFGSNDVITIPAGVASNLDREVTVSLWAMGASEQPVNDATFWGANGGYRVLGTHIPWGNGSVYWDAGAAGSTYDRISKACAPGDYKGRWTFWTFAKDADAGTMNIYLDGASWHTGPGTRSMSGITAFTIGSSVGGSSGYRGSIDEFRLSRVARSSDWIAASYANMASPGTFAGFGPVEKGFYDGDGDGLADRWERHHFGGTGAVAGEPGSDPDGDGRSTQEEYVAGTDPTSAVSRFRLFLSGDGGRVTVIMPTLPSDAPGLRDQDRFYSLQNAGTVTGAWNTVPDYLDIPANGTPIRFTNALPKAPGYYRGRVRVE